MTSSAKSDQLKKQFIAAMRVCRVMNMLNRFFSASLANAILALKYSIAFRFPLSTCQVFVILLFRQFINALLVTHDVKGSPLGLCDFPNHKTGTRTRRGVLNY